MKHRNDEKKDFTLTELADEMSAAWARDLPLETEQTDCSSSSSNDGKRGVSGGVKSLFNQMSEIQLESWTIRTYSKKQIQYTAEVTIWR